MEELESLICLVLSSFYLKMITHWKQHETQNPVSIKPPHSSEEWTKSMIVTIGETVLTFLKNRESHGYKWLRY